MVPPVDPRLGRVVPRAPRRRSRSGVDPRSCYTRAMPRVAPFIALRYDTAVAGPLDLVTAPPYDVISASRRRSLLEASPFSIVHLDLAEGSEDPGDPESRYARAGQLLEAWESEGALVRTPEPVYFAYEMAFEHMGVSRAVRGVLVALELEPWGANVIPHERTMPGPLQDRLRLLRATQTHLSPVYGTIAGPCPPLAEVLHAAALTPPAEETRDDQGVRHRLWPLPSHLDVAGWLREEPLLIADGHHRYTTALRYRTERDAAQGPGPWDRVFALIVDAAAEHLPVLPFHRLQTAGSVRPSGERVPDLDEPPVHHLRRTALGRPGDRGRGGPRVPSRASPGSPPGRPHAPRGDPRRSDAGGISAFRPRRVARELSGRGRGGTGRLAPAGDHPGADQGSDRARGAPATEVDVFLAQAEDRDGDDACWTIRPGADVTRRSVPAS